MRFDFLQHHLQHQQQHGHGHLSRRDLLKAGAAGTAVAALSGTLLSGVAGASDDDDDDDRDWDDHTGPHDGGHNKKYDDSYSTAGALDGTWAKDSAARYGKDDQRGSINEITHQKTAAALGLAAGKRTKTVIMGHMLRNGFPAFIGAPQRRFDQRLTMLGYAPKDPTKWFTTTTTGLAGEDEWRKADRERGPLGWNQGGTPFGTNQLSGHEERFPEGGTYQIATQFDGLSHIGVKEVFYNGWKATDFATPTAVTKIGNEQVGPIVTRGVLIDVLSMKMEKKAAGDLQTIAGKTMLSKSYRITIEDIEECMRRRGVKRLEPGDAVVIRTGWHQLAEAALDAGIKTKEGADLAAQYLGTEPGIYVREAKWLADHRPALVASDSWALEVLGNPINAVGGLAFPVHNELITHYGIRIGEGVISDGLVAHGVGEFCYCYMPNHAYGSTAGCTAPFALIKA
ncbi:MAG: cyclase family protein [Acidimicrobiales bacterium]